MSSDPGNLYLLNEIFSKGNSRVDHLQAKYLELTKIKYQTEYYKDRWKANLDFEKCTLQIGYREIKAFMGKNCLTSYLTFK